MSNKYINLYNNFIKLTTNKTLYETLVKQDTFGDRLVLFLVHFAFFLKAFKNEKNTRILQDIYDSTFRQLELSIREIGYGDQSINKKMKVYINLFHSLLSEIHFWDDLDKLNKQKKISLYLENFSKNQHLVDYFDEFYNDLTKKTLNSYLKSVSNA
jgi:cytochrome b pre-mRNA-processing protein 3